MGLRLSYQDQYVGADNGQAEVQQDDGSLRANVPEGQVEKKHQCEVPAGGLVVYSGVAVCTITSIARRRSPPA